jgi:hypothetical protein
MLRSVQVRTDMARCLGKPMLPDPMQRQRHANGDESRGRHRLCDVGSVGRD